MTNTLVIMIMMRMRNAQRSVSVNRIDILNTVALIPVTNATHSSGICSTVATMGANTAMRNTESCH